MTLCDLLSYARLEHTKVLEVWEADEASLCSKCRT